MLQIEIGQLRQKLKTLEASVEMANTELREVSLKSEKTEQDMANLIITKDLEFQNLDTKIKLLEDALTRRNLEVEQGESNNKQLLNLLEKYDYKLDELQEDNELKDMKIFEYERSMTDEKPKIKLDSIEDKVRFLVQVLHRLKCIYIDGVTEMNRQMSGSD